MFLKLGDPILKVIQLVGNIVKNQSLLGSTGLHGLEGAFSEGELVWLCKGLYAHVTGFLEVFYTIIYFEDPIDEVLNCIFVLRWLYNAMLGHEKQEISLEALHPVLEHDGLVALHNLAGHLLISSFLVLLADLEVIKGRELVQVDV